MAQLGSRVDRDPGRRVRRWKAVVRGNHTCAAGPNAPMHPTRQLRRRHQRRWTGDCRLGAAIPGAQIVALQRKLKLHCRVHPSTLVMTPWVTAEEAETASGA